MFIKKLNKNFGRTLQGPRYLVINTEEISFNCNKRTLNIICNFLPFLPKDSKVSIYDFNSFTENCKLSLEGHFIKEYPTPLSQEELARFCDEKIFFLSFTWEENGEIKFCPLYKVNFPLSFEGKKYDVRNLGTKIGEIIE